MACADCVLDIAGCKLEWGKKHHPSDTRGKFVVLVGGCYFAMCIDSDSGFSSVEAHPYVFPIKTETLFRALEVEFRLIQIRRCVASAS